MSNPPNPDPLSSRPDPRDSPLPADPLLRNGSFIDASAVRNSEAPPQQPSSASVNGATPVKSRRIVPPSESTSWLPPGWMVEDRVRTNGATAGTSDRYYIEPVTKRRFRSKREVQYYLETGEHPKDKRKREAANLKPDVDSPETSGNDKASKKPKGPEITFDHTNVPDGVEWVLTDVDDDVWTPYIGGEKVPEYTRQSWEFEMLN